MGKLYLYYKNNSSSLMGELLNVKIDDTITSKIKKNEIYELELENGKHNIKMYCNDWMSDRLVGYLDENIEINEETYYIYKCPMTVSGKGKLEKFNFNSVDEFKKYKKSVINKYKIFIAILIIISIIIYLFC